MVPESSIFRSAPEAVIAFNMALANGFFNFPNGERVERHPECYFIAGDNTDGTGPTMEYPTAQRLDGSTLNRFKFITIGYDMDLELRLGHETAAKFNPDYDQSQVTEFHGTVIKARQFVKDNAIDAIISPRQTIGGGAMIGKGSTCKQAVAAILGDMLTTAQLSQLAV